ncbi:hypothetical protein KAR91_48965 [Candidatus Pacearchaeota archaeon]|nr:hypothetical protein [Candidatus Pacearchaeota archaeon]
MIYQEKKPRNQCIYHCHICGKIKKGDLIVQIGEDEYAHPYHRGIDDLRVYDGIFMCIDEFKYREL